MSPPWLMVVFLVHPAGSLMLRSLLKNKKRGTDNLSLIQKLLISLKIYFFIISTVKHDKEHSITRSLSDSGLVSY